MFKLSFCKMGTVQKFQRIEPDTIEQFCALDYLFIKLMVIWFVCKCHVLYLFEIFLHETIHSIGQDHGVQPSSVRKLVSLSL